MRSWKKPECNGQNDDSVCFQTGGCFPDTSDASWVYDCVQDASWEWVRLFIFPGKCGKTASAHYGINLPKSAKKDAVQWLYFPDFAGSGTTTRLGIAYNGKRPAPGGGVLHDFYFQGSAGHVSLRNYESHAYDCVPLGNGASVTVVSAGTGPHTTALECQLGSGPAGTCAPPTGAPGKGGGAGSGGVIAAVAIAGVVVFLLVMGSSSASSSGTG
jgi:hypothetical protein